MTYGVIASARRDLRRCSTSCCAGRGSALKLRAQITSRRLAQESRILIDVDLHRPRASLCRDFRHHGDPDAGGDHLADRIEIVQPRAKAQARAEPRGVSG